MSIWTEHSAPAPAWCPGCGNFAILKTFREAAAEMGLEPHRLVVCSGIGQAAKFPHYIPCNTFNGLHGRALPAAQGIKLANHALTVVCETGDGDCYGEGGNHLLHAMRRNLDITLFVHDNQVYGLTKGQASPTSLTGMVTKTQPDGVLAEPFNPLTLAIAMDCSFVARGFSGEGEQLKTLMQAAIAHHGFALVDILQPCVTFNRVNTYAWYRDRIELLPATYDPENREEAFRTSLRWPERIPIGILYRKNRPVYEDGIPALRNGPLVLQGADSDRGRQVIRDWMS